MRACMRVCMCAGVCVCVCVRACVRACVKGEGGVVPIVRRLHAWCPCIAP